MDLTSELWADTVAMGFTKSRKAYLNALRIGTAIKEMMQAAGEI